MRKSVSSTKEEVVRLNLTLPLSVAEQLRAEVPERQRNQFVADLVRRELKRMSQIRAWEESAGAWGWTIPPEFQTRLDAALAHRGTPVTRGAI